MSKGSRWGVESGARGLVRCNAPYLLLTGMIVILFLFLSCFGCAEITSTQSISTITVPPQSTTAPKPTIQPTIQFTPTIQPTLNAQEQIIAIEELLQYHPECRLPCWWGIQPGVTSPQEIEHHFASLGLPAPILVQLTSRSSPVNSTNYVFVDPAGDVSMSINWMVRNDKLLHLSMFLNNNNDQNLNPLHQYWMDYSIEEIFLAYGKPSQAYIYSTNPNFGSPDHPFASYDLWILYDEMETIIRYQGEMKNQPVYQICPKLSDNQVYSIRLDIKSPDFAPSLENLTIFPLYSEEEIHPLEDVAGMSLDEFYNIMSSQNAVGGCFNVSRDKFIQP